MNVFLNVVHARGFGAHGEFQVYEDLSEYTSADFLTHPEKQHLSLCVFYCTRF